MANPAGISGLAGLQTLVDTSPEASAEDRSGGPADQRHARPGEQAQPYSWQSMQVPGAATVHPAPPAGLVDDPTYFGSFLVPALIEQGAPYWDTAPYTHAAPYPADPIGDGSMDPDNTARQLQQNYALRLKAGKAGFADPSIATQVPQQDNWTEIWEVNPGSDDLENVGPQTRSGAAPAGRGNTDRRQSNAHQNQYGFDSKHMHRRYAENSIPGNYMWMTPMSRPLIKSLAGPARPPIGPGSQFEGQDLGESFSLDGAILQGSPSAYQGPPEPYVGAPVYGDQSAPSWYDIMGVGV